MTGWTTTASPSNQWRVQGVTQRRITEAVLLRRTEQGDIRIVDRGGGEVWTKTTALPPVGWAIVDDGESLWSMTPLPSGNWVIVE